MILDDINHRSIVAATREVTLVRPPHSEKQATKKSKTGGGQDGGVFQNQDVVRSPGKTHRASQT